MGVGGAGCLSRANRGMRVSSSASLDPPLKMAEAMSVTCSFHPARLALLLSPSNSPEISKLSLLASHEGSIGVTGCSRLDFRVAVTKLAPELDTGEPGSVGTMTSSVAIVYG